MIDINNLNRIRGILSARQGAEIPKFQNPAGPLAFNTTIGFDDPGFQQFKQSANLFGSYQDLNTYITLKEKYPQATSEQLVQYYRGQIPQTTATPGANPDQGQKPTTNIPTDNATSMNGTSEVATKIPGDPGITVNTATENSAQVNAEVAKQQQQNKVEEIQAQQIAAVPKIDTSTSINNQKIASPMNGAPASDFTNIKIDTPEAVKSAGRKISEETYQKLQKEKAISGARTQITNAIGQGLDMANSIVGAKQAATDSGTTKSLDAAYDGVSNLASNFGPIGKVVGTAMKAASLVGDLSQSMGGGTDQQTTMDKIMDSSFFSWNIGMLNGFAGSNTDKFSVDQNLMAQVGSSYGGTVDDLNKAASKAGKKYGLFSTKAKNKANQVIADATSKQNTMESISNAAQDQRIAAQSMGEQAGLAYQRMLEGGYDQKYTYAAKQGGILEWNPIETLEWQPQIELNWELPTFKEGGNLEFFEELEWIPEFKEGGKTKEFDIPEIEETNQKNVIPEGALHKNKHHMEHAEGLTKKGIPVIDEDGEQQAEIEHSEIIFTLEVTKKLEEYYEIFYSESASNKEKEQAALEAGKLLVYQILENTEDRTGLIESCKKGGTLNFKKSTEDLIEEALEWIPTITIIEEVIEEVKEEEKPKKKSEKEQMKEAIKEVLIELLTK